MAEYLIIRRKTGNLAARNDEMEIAQDFADVAKSWADHVTLSMPTFELHPEVVDDGLGLLRVVFRKRGLLSDIPKALKVLATLANGEFDAEEMNMIAKPLSEEDKKLRGLV